jgi:hypothetical protein
LLFDLVSGAAATAPIMIVKRKIVFHIKAQIGFLVVCLFIAAVAEAYEYDPNDFAIEVIEYVEGSGVGTDSLPPYNLFNDPNNALGRPTLETTGDNWLISPFIKVPVVPVYPPFRAFELVTIGNGGRLIVKFNHHIANDKNNPYGIDFIVYGNARQEISGGQVWANGNPQQTTVTGDVFAEPGIVAVSQDGINWYYFSDGPYADDFAPTASYMWDDVNNVWGEELDPTRPIDPSLTAVSLDGKTVAEVIEIYNGSAGGTGFDIALLGLDWIQYVRIENKPGSDGTTEIDAIADVSCCGDYKHPYPAGDLNEDCRVDFVDFAILARDWLAGSDWDDLVTVADNWLECSWKCQ